jgi:hypothetical protein
MKTGKNGRCRAAAEPWEVERLHREFPVSSEKEVEKAAEECKAQRSESQQREKLARCVQRKLSK